MASRFLIFIAFLLSCWTLGCEPELCGQACALDFEEGPPDFIPACDRPDAVITLILKDLSKKHCEDVTAEDLLSIKSLTFQTVDGIPSRLGYLTPEALWGLQNLEELSCLGCELYDILPGSFDQLMSLKKFELSYNQQMRTLPEPLFQMSSSIKEVVISFNPLLVISDTFFLNAPELQMLSLRGQNLTRIPPSILKGLTGLTTLLLNDNSLTKLPPEIFMQLPQLIFLDLRNNLFSAQTKDEILVLSKKTGRKINVLF